MYASGGGLGSCACPGFDEHCSTRHKSTHPCSLRPSEDLKDKDKLNKYIYIYIYLFYFFLPFTTDFINLTPGNQARLHALSVNLKRASLQQHHCKHQSNFTAKLGLWSSIKFQTELLLTERKEEVWGEHAQTVDLEKEVKTSGCMLKFYKYLISEQQLLRVTIPDITPRHLPLHI